MRFVPVTPAQRDDMLRAIGAPSVDALFDETVPDAVRLLATMMSDFAPEAEDVEREKMVVEHESGAVHSPLQMWWSRQAFTQRKPASRRDHRLGSGYGPGRS